MSLICSDSFPCGGEGAPLLVHGPLDRPRSKGVVGVSVDADPLAFTAGAGSDEGVECSPLC